MPNVQLLNQQGAVIGELQLSEEVFGVPVHQQAIFDAVVAERAGMRQGTQKAKTRAEVRGGGRKPWRQKGTGRARQGTIRAPQWRGGGVVFAPTPRSHAIKVNKSCPLGNEKRIERKSPRKCLYRIDKIELDNFKTKSFVEVLNNIKADGKVLVVLNDANPNVELAGRNLPNVIIHNVNHISVYQVLNADCMVLTQDVVSHYEEVLK